MAKSSTLALGSLCLLMGAWVGCGTPETDETTSSTRRALTSSLFQPYVAYPTGSRAEAVAIGDLDSDGRNDIALVTSYYFDAANDYTVHVFLQAPDGTLKPRVKYPVGLRSSSIDIGDVNGDGRADVVVGLDDSRGVQIGVLLQNSSGTLDPLVSYPTRNANQIKIGDFNGDGRLDVAGMDWGGESNEVDVWLQTEGGSLAPPATYQAPHGGYDELDAADVDGDGRTDLVVMSGQGNQAPDVSVLLQTADGSFDPATSYSLPLQVNPGGVAVGDTNGDGRADIVLSYGGNRPSSFIGRFLQNAEGGMDAPISHSSHDIPSAIVLADVDEDGRKDVVVTHSGWARLGVYRQFPGGEIVAEELYPIGAASHFARQALAVGDINGDGRPDAVIADSLGGMGVLRHVQDVSLGLTITAPAGGSQYIGVPMAVRWVVGDNVPIAAFDVSASFNGGGTWAPVAGCIDLPATARECIWSPAGPANPTTRVRVTARTSAGESAANESTFALIAPRIDVTPLMRAFVGSPTEIRWSHTLPADYTVRIELSRDGGASFETLADAVPITGAFTWNVSGPTGTGRIRVTANGPLAASGVGGTFDIVTPSLTVTAPVAGITVYAGMRLSVSWTHNVNLAFGVRVELSRDGGATFERLTGTVTNGGSFGQYAGIMDTTVSGPDCADAFVRVTTEGPVVAIGTSARFTIVAPTLSVTSPVAGTTVAVGATLTVTWSSTFPASATGVVELSRDGGATFQRIGNSTSNSGSFAWVVTGPETNAARIRVNFSPLAAGTSDIFAIGAPSLVVTVPSAPMYIGQPASLTWTHTLPATDTMRIDLSRDGGATFETLAAAAPNTGAFAWSVTGPETAQGLVRIRSNGASGATGISGNVNIVRPDMTILAPTAGALAFGSLWVTWKSNVQSALSVKIELSIDGGANFYTLAAASPNIPFSGSSASFPVDGDVPNARVRVTTNGPIAVSATSDSFMMVRAHLSLTSPTPGAVVAPGTALSIRWSTNVSPSSTAKIDVSRDGGGTYTTLAAAAPNTGTFVWTVDGPDTAGARVRVTLNASPALFTTSGIFAITTPALTVVGPAEGTTFHAGSPVTVAWTHNLPADDTVRVELSRDGGGSYEVVAPAAPNTGSFVWSATGPDTAAARFRVTGNGTFAAGGVGPTFTILTPTVTVTAPASGNNWAIGTARTIAWISSNLSGATVRVELSRDGGLTWTTLAAAAPSSGSLAWTATAPATGAAVVRVSSNGAVPASGTSPTFTIGSPALTVTSPAAGASWTIGATQTIAWTSNLLSTATVKIQISRDGGTTFTTLASAAPNSGTFSWKAGGAVSTAAVVRVTANGFVGATDLSDVFSLVAGKVTVTSPNTAVTWTVGTTGTITWTHNAGAAASFKIEVSRSGVWSVIAPAVAAQDATSGRYDWTVIGPTTRNAKVRVTWTANTAAKDTSDVSFRIN